MPCDPDFPPSSPEPHFIKQGDLNDLVRDLELPKSKAELLGSRLQQWYLPADGVTVSVSRERQKGLVTFFFMKVDLVACNNVDGLMAAINIIYHPDEWRPFIKDKS
jgi:hypothetical protein